MSPKWRVFKVSFPFGRIWVAYQATSRRSETFESFGEAFRFAEAAASESWGYRA